jgi:hypothetical protein
MIAFAVVAYGLIKCPNDDLEFTAAVRVALFPSGAGSSSTLPELILSVLHIQYAYV